MGGSTDLDTERICDLAQACEAGGGVSIRFVALDLLFRNPKLFGELALSPAARNACLDEQGRDISERVCGERCGLAGLALICWAGSSARAWWASIWGW